MHGYDLVKGTATALLITQDSRHESTKESSSRLEVGYVGDTEAIRT